MRSQSWRTLSVAGSAHVKSCGPPRTSFSSRNAINGVAAPSATSWVGTTARTSAPSKRYRRLIRPTKPTRSPAPPWQTSEGNAGSAQGLSKKTRSKYRVADLILVCALYRKLRLRNPTTSGRSPAVKGRMINASSRPARWWSEAARHRYKTWPPNSGIREARSLPRWEPTLLRHLVCLPFHGSGW